MEDKFWLRYMKQTKIMGSLVQDNGLPCPCGVRFPGTKTKAWVQKELQDDKQRPGQPWILQSQSKWPARFPNHWLHGDLPGVGRLMCKNLGQSRETRWESSTRSLRQKTQQALTQRSAAECLVDPGFLTMLCALLQATIISSRGQVSNGPRGST